MQLSGFYNIKSLRTNELRRFYRDALKLSNYVVIESKYAEGNEFRGRSYKYTIQDYMNMIHNKNHNVCIDRSIQGAGISDNDRGEVGFKLAPKFDKEWHQITFEMRLDNLKILTDKYGLIME